MNNIQQALTRKLGPLPAWVWAVVAGVGIFIYRQRKAAQGGSGDQTNPQDTLSYYGPYGQQYSPIQGGEFGSGNPAGGPPVINVYSQPGHKAHKGHRKHHKPHPKHPPKGSGHPGKWEWANGKWNWVTTVAVHTHHPHSHRPRSHVSHHPASHSGRTRRPTGGAAPVARPRKHR